MEIYHKHTYKYFIIHFVYDMMLNFEVVFNKFNVTYTFTLSLQFRTEINH
jgi:hypothetical protein